MYKPFLFTLLMYLSAAAQAQDKLADKYEWQAIAPGMWAHYGLIEDFSPANRGDISNAGLVVGARCAAIIDTGGSPSVGKAQLAAAKALTDKPICYVINTHVHPDHVMGNVVYKTEPAIQFAGNAKLAPAMRSRGRIYLNAMQRELKEHAAGAEMMPPSLIVSDELTIDLGARRLLLKAWPTAHTDHDLTVFDESTGTLWTGDLLFVSHAPVVDGSVKGWQQVLKQMESLKVQRVVPGHGKALGAWPSDLKAQGHYLQQIESDMRDAIKRGKSLPQALAEQDTAPARIGNNWQLLESFHKRNLTAVYAELEWE
jgi:quinoprotein relay system zinc metallohydrolase 2